MHTNKAVIIGGGPAGLTAAYELLKKTDIQPIVLEMSADIGGISKTIAYRGNRIDLGGHRFFSKSSRVMRWWQDVLPLQGAPARDDLLLGREIPKGVACARKQSETNNTVKCEAADPEKSDKVLLLRQRVSRILFMQRFFDYPVSINGDLIRALGFRRVTRIGTSYLYRLLVPIKPEASLEDFFINRFGNELYKTFFKFYTEKVWGVPCDQIKPEWGSQRVKGLSILGALTHALKSVVFRNASIEQKDVETSLISQFMYPKLGPGQLWEEVAHRVVEQGGRVLLQHRVVGVRNEQGRITRVTVKKEASGEVLSLEADYVFSTMPVKELVESFENPVPPEVAEVGGGLMYRDFLTVGLLLNGLKVKNETRIKTVNGLVPDNWIYVQERNVKLGRIQIFNNWSPYLVADPNKVWLGLEYFCNVGDEIWSRSDQEMIDFAAEELAQINFIERSDVLDGTVIRMPNTYPCYTGTYDKLHIIKQYLDTLENFFPIGRNGLHRYNNSDHSMLTAMLAVENIVAGRTDKENIWAVNTEEDYHEEN